MKLSQRQRLFSLWLNVCLLAGAFVVAQAQRSDTLTLTIQNPSQFARADELIALPVSEISQRAPNFDAATCIVVEVANGATAQLPSQADDLDGDGSADEICFLLSLAPSQTRQVTLVYGPGAPARATFLKRTQAKFSQQFEGLGWESDVIGYRLYFDERNAIDVYGKHDRRLSLDKFAERSHNYHADSAWGRDVMKVGDALGVGSFGLWKDQQLSKLAKVAQRRWRLVVNGPVRSSIELQGEGWQVADQQFHLKARFSAVAGQRWTKVEVTLEGASAGFQLATGIIKNPQTVVLRDQRAGVLASWGQQVESTPGELGLAVIVPPARLAQFTEDKLNHLALLSLQASQPLTYYLAAAWDKEAEAITSAAAWESHLQQTAARLGSPSVIRWEAPTIRAGTNRQPGSGLALQDYAPVSMLKVEAHEIPQAKFPAIDFHNHINNDDPQRLLGVMKDCNLAVLVNFTGGFGETLKAQVAKFAAHPDRFIVFANVDWSRINEPNFGQQAAQQLEADVKAGARGLKIFKNLGLTIKDQTGKLVAIDDPRLDPIWAKAGELGIPVAIHSSDPDAFFQPIDRFNERYEELQQHPDWSFYGTQFPAKEVLLRQRNHIIERHPRTTFVALHVANHPENLAEVATWLDRYPNMYVEVGARLNELGRQPYTARRFFMKYADRILFGTDSTPAASTYRTWFRFLETYDEHFDYFTRPTQGRWKIYGIGLPEEVLEKVYRGNAKKLLKLN